VFRPKREAKRDAVRELGLGRGGSGGLEGRGGSGRESVLVGSVYVGYCVSVGRGRGGRERCAEVRVAGLRRAGNLDDVGQMDERNVRVWLICDSQSVLTYRKTMTRKPTS
jgi:hypothetical protein